MFVIHRGIVSKKRRTGLVKLQIEYKAIVFISCLRAIGISAIIHLAKVKNQIGAELLIE